MNLDAVRASPFRRRKIETVRRRSYRLPSARRRAVKAGAVLLALGALGLLLVGEHRGALAMVALAVAVGGAA
jgi:hypothetical protein